MMMMMIYLLMMIIIISLLGYIGLTTMRIQSIHRCQGYIGRTMVVFSCSGFILSGIEFFEFLGCEALLARPDCSSYEAHYHRPPLPTLGSICLFIQILIRSLSKETIMVRPLFGLDVVHSARYLHILAKPIPSEGAFWNSWVVRLVVGWLGCTL